MSQVVDLRKIQKTRKIKVEAEKSESKDTIPTKIEWVAPEFTQYKKGKNWFVLPGFVAFALVIIAIILKNFLFAIGIVVAAFVVYIYTNKKPREIKFSVSGKGVQVDNKIYPLDTIKSFWIFYNPPEIKEISIRSKKTFVPYIKIPLGDQNPAEVRRFLLRFLPERKHRESVVDEWARRIRF